MPFARLLHLLTHHPDFEWHEPGGNEEDEESKKGITSMQNLKDIARWVPIYHALFGFRVLDTHTASRFIELYLDCLAHRDNVGLLFAIAGHLKAVRDRFSDNNKVCLICTSTNSSAESSWSASLLSFRACSNHNPQSRRETWLVCSCVPWKDFNASRHLPQCRNSRGENKGVEDAVLKWRG